PKDTFYGRATQAGFSGRTEIVIVGIISHTDSACGSLDSSHLPNANGGAVGTGLSSRVRQHGVSLVLASPTGRWNGSSKLCRVDRLALGQEGGKQGPCRTRDRASTADQVVAQAGAHLSTWL